MANYQYNPNANLYEGYSMNPDQFAEAQYLYPNQYPKSYGMMSPAPAQESFANYGAQMGQHYEDGLAAAQEAVPSEGQMPDFGSQAYQQMMGHAAPANASQTLPKFNPASGADWARGLGLFAKGAILGAPKQAGPAPANPQSNSGKDVSKESTYNQGDYWGWLFNS
jgi:hypothetical protein